MPEPHQFAALLSTLHQKSVSPTDKFGFHITTCAGNLPQYVGWEDSWETFFAKSMRWALDLEIERKGRSEELDILSRALFDKVIPRLLRPLENEGQTVKPSLVHGDLWYANAGLDVDSGQPLVFDACCFFAHNECEFYKQNFLSQDFANTMDLKMSSASGDQPVTGSEPNTLLPTTSLSKFRRQKRISKAVLISTGCKTRADFMP